MVVLYIYLSRLSFYIRVHDPIQYLLSGYVLLFVKLAFFFRKNQIILLLQAHASEFSQTCKPSLSELKMFYNIYFEPLVHSSLGFVNYTLIFRMDDSGVDAIAAKSTISSA